VVAIVLARGCGVKSGGEPPHSRKAEARILG
jgi:hypothetical protein